MHFSSTNLSPYLHRVSLTAFRAAFSLVEVVMLIAILGVLATVAVTMVGKQKGAVLDTKLLSDISALNHHVAMYLADGGSLTGLTSPQAVIDRMKRTRVQADWQTHTGAASGRLVDTRLRATITNSANADGTPRARWNTRTERFELTTAGGQAVTAFTFDEALRNTEYGTDSNRRAGRVKYNASTKGWIWGGAGASGAIAYQNPGGTSGDGTTDLFDPDELVPVTPPPDDGGGRRRWWWWRHTRSSPASDSEHYSFGGHFFTYCLPHNFHRQSEWCSWRDTFAAPLSEKWRRLGAIHGCSHTAVAIRCRGGEKFRHRHRCLLG